MPRTRATLFTTWNKPELGHCELKPIETAQYRNVSLSKAAEVTSFNEVFLNLVKSKVGLISSP